MNAIIDMLKSHRSIRKFRDKSVEQSIINELIRAGQAAATSNFQQAYTVIQVEDSAKREKLAACSGDQAYIVDSAAFMVFCADMKRHQLCCHMHGEEMQTGFIDRFITATADCSLFAQNVAVAAESMGLGIVYIGGLRNQIDTVSELLELPDLVFPVFGLCLGYPDQDPEIKPRLPLELILKKDRYDDNRDIAIIRKYDEQVLDYYRSRTGSDKEVSWSQKITGMVKKEARPHMFGFLNRKGIVTR